MDHQKAVKLAVKALKEQIQAVAVDANMHDRYRADYPLAVKSSKSRAEWIEAIRILEESAQKRSA